MTTDTWLRELRKPFSTFSFFSESSFASVRDFKASSKLSPAALCRPRPFIQAIEYFINIVIIVNIIIMILVQNLRSILPDARAACKQGLGIIKVLFEG